MNNHTSDGGGADSPSDHPTGRVNVCAPHGHVMPCPWKPCGPEPYPEFKQPAPDPIALIEQDRDEQEISDQAKYDTKRIIARRRAEREAAEVEGEQRILGFVNAEAVTERPTRWLWPLRIPANSLTLLIGKGGSAKSMWLALFAAYITNGAEIDGERYARGPRDVIYAYTEDHVQETIKPRLVAAGADVSRVHFVQVTFDGQADKLCLPRDCERLGGAAVDLGAAAILYDPLSSFISSSKGRNDAADMRSVYEAINAMHDQFNLAGLGLGHVRKAVSTSLLDAYMGSSEQGNVVRAAFGVAANPDPENEGEYVLSHEKHNLAPQQASLRYRIEGASYVLPDGTVIPSARVVVLGRTEVTVSDILRDQSEGLAGSAKREAKEFIRDFLERHGVSPPTDVIKDGQKEGHSQPTLYRAARELVRDKKMTKIGGAWALTERKH